MQKFISKWLSGDTATGLVMKRFKQCLHAHCPRCGEDEEHLLHVLICPAEATVDFRKPLLTDLELAEWRRHSPRYCWVSSYQFDLLVRGSFRDRTSNSFCHSFNPTGSVPSVTGNWLVRPSLRFYSGTIIGYLPTIILLFHPMSAFTVLAIQNPFRIVIPWSSNWDII